MPVKYTNKYNLPESFVNAVLVDEHVSLGDISVTQLIDAPQIRMLKRTNDYETDVSDMIIMALGTGLHTVLERGDIKGSVHAKALQRASGILLELGEEKGAKWLKKVIKDKLDETIDTNVITEQTLTIEVLGWTISGTFDRFTQDIGLLEDYKTASVGYVSNPEGKKSWNAQQNIYAYMMGENDLEVKEARIIAVLKDWTKMKINTAKDYPKIPIVVHPIPLAEPSKIKAYIEKRVRLHQRAEEGENIECTPKERWAKADIWKVVPKGNKRSIRNCITEKHAEAYIEQKQSSYKKELTIEFVKGESFRCANGFCAVSEFCPQYKREREEAAKEAESM